MENMKPFIFTASNTGMTSSKKGRRKENKCDKSINHNFQTPFCFQPLISLFNVTNSTQNQFDFTQVKSEVLAAQERSETKFKSEPLEYSLCMERTPFLFTASNTGITSSKKCRNKEKKCNKTIYHNQTPFCFQPWISLFNVTNSTQNQFDFTQVKSEVMAAQESSETKFKFEPLEYSLCMERTSNQSKVSTEENSVGLFNFNQLEVSTTENCSFANDLSSEQNSEKTKIYISSDFIQKVSKALQIEETVVTSCTVVSKFETSFTCEPSKPRKSIRANDPVYELIRQHRLSWWSDDTLPSFKFQSTPNRDRFSKVRESWRNLDKTGTELNNSCNYKRERKCRARELEPWQAVMQLSDSNSPEFDSQRQIVTKQKEQKTILQLNKFSDESDLDDSGSSLDGSYQHHSLYSSDSSDCESWECSPTYYTVNAPPTSSRIFEDSPAEFETMFQKKNRKQFWNSNLVKHPDKNFTEDLGFVAVVLQALQCLCQCRLVKSKKIDLEHSKNQLTKDLEERSEERNFKFPKPN